jgi:hypothetical protein
MMRQRQIQDGESLPIASPAAHLRNSIPICKLYSFHNVLNSKRVCGERRFQMLFQHTENARELLGFVVAIQGGFFDEFIQSRTGDGLCMSSRRFSSSSSFAHSSLICVCIWYPSEHIRLVQTLQREFSCVSSRKMVNAGLQAGSAGAEPGRRTEGRSKLRWTPMK